VPLFVPGHHTAGAVRADPISPDTGPSPPRAENQGVGLTLVILQAVGVLWLLGWSRLFTEENTNFGHGVTGLFDVVLALVILAYPLFLIGSALLSRRARRRGRSTRAVVYSLVPLVPILLQLALVTHEDITDCCAMPTGSDTSLVSTPDTT